MSLAQLLKQPSPILMDGAMGTRLYQLGTPFGSCFDAVTLEHPKRVAAIHRDYVDAGAQIIATNTFGANRARLAKFNLTQLSARINAAAAKVAAQAAKGQALIAGTIGPAFDPKFSNQTRSVCRQQVEELADGVDLFICETFAGTDSLSAAIAGIRDSSDKPIIAMVALRDVGLTLDGTKLSTLQARMTDLTPAAWGINCTDPATILASLPLLEKDMGPPLCLVPNAGLPTQVNGSKSWPVDPAAAAEFARCTKAAGAALIGGCCGMEPAHIAAMKTALA